MLFNSYVFLFSFLPLTLLGYFTLNRYNLVLQSKLWLIGASLYFYTFWSFKNLPLILTSLTVNYLIGYFLNGGTTKLSKLALLRIGLAFNLVLLCFFKYADFAIINFNWIFNAEVGLLALALPLGISFFTLQQIAYLIDSYEGVTERKSFIDYAHFVTFFPQLISGPIVNYNHMMPQISSTENKRFKIDNFSIGIFIFSIGLAKKVLISETFADWARPGFEEARIHDFFSAWKTSLSYVFQLYFDFSGYTDMAIGIGHMFNIKLPHNFNSPYRSKTVVEFWSRWHMTLGQFINNYVFTPLVRSMPKMTFRNTMIATFTAMFLAGVWHGAGWTFVVYAILNGLALVVNHWRKKKKKKLSPVMAWLCTFIFINVTFVIFRAKSLESAWSIIKAMSGASGVAIPKIGIKSVGLLKDYGFKMGTYLYPNDYFFLLALALTFYALFKWKNTSELEKEFKPTRALASACAVAFVISLFNMNKITEFIYFNF
jgi:alginate O-acetyltransferase complex protein AlgI